MGKLDEEKIYKRFLNYLSPRSLSWITKDLLTARELTKLLNTKNFFPQQDVNSVNSDLIIDKISEEFFQNKEFSRKIISIFSKKRLKEINKFVKIDKKTLLEYIGDGKKIFREGRVGKVLWAIIKDDRNEINTVAKIFIEKIEKLINGSKKESIITNIKNNKNNIIKKRKINLKEKSEENITKNIRNLEEESKANINKINQLTTNNNKLKNEISLLNSKVDKINKENLSLFEELEYAKKALLDQEIFLQEKKKLERENKKLLENTKKYGREENYQILLQREILQLKGEVARWKIKFGKHEKLHSSPAPKIKKYGLKSRVGVFVDVQNIYYGAKIGINYQAKLDFDELLQLVTEGRDPVTAIAYIVQTPEIDQAEFIKTLERVGYHIKSKDLRRRADGSAKGDWDLGIAMDIISCYENLDIVVLVSGDGDFVELIKFLKNKNIIVEVVSFQSNTSRDLIEMADEFYPIEEDSENLILSN